MTEYKCPKCKTVLMERGEFFPFCSQRCKSADLGAWATGRYAIPGDPVPADELPVESPADGDSRKKNDAH